MLVEDRGYSDLLGPPSSPLMLLFQDDNKRKRVRDLIYDAFRLYFVVDPTKGGHLRVRLSKTEPSRDEQSLDKSARNFHAAAPHIKEYSDGVQAFVGIISTLVAGNHLLVLLDEPEAFLHPPLARKLGYQVGASATAKKSSLFVATHSSDFIVGCLQASQEVKVVRLEYAEGKSRGRLVSNRELRDLYSIPLMRSSNVISALFYDGVVVTESDNDRSLYAEIYHRISESLPSPAPSILFLNAQNKQTVRQILEPLRRCGVPTATVVDIDVIKEGGRAWTKLLSAAQVPDALANTLGGLRGIINKALSDTGKDMKVDGGIDLLDDGERLSATHLFDTLDNHGIFVVRRGELESWLRALEPQGKKTDWVVSVFEKMGSNAADPKYVKPSDGDVWSFLRNITAWIGNPRRAGMQ